MSSDTFEARRYLYVCSRDVEEAIGLGAEVVAGDSRLLAPRHPSSRAIDRFRYWQSPVARMDWLREMAFLAFSDMASPDDPEDLETALDEVMGLEGLQTRVILWIPRNLIGSIEWRGDMHYHEPAGYLSVPAESITPELAAYATPSAYRAWVNERRIAKGFNDFAGTVFASGASDQGANDDDGVPVIGAVLEAKSRLRDESRTDQRRCNKRKTPQLQANSGVEPKASAANPGKGAPLAERNTRR